MEENLSRSQMIARIKAMFGLISQFGIVDVDCSDYSVRKIYLKQLETSNYLKGDSHEKESEQANTNTSVSTS